MNDIDMMIEREKIFEQYRSLVKDVDRKYEEMMKCRKSTDRVSNELEQLRTDRDKLKRLIDMMIIDDIDPVEAKLKCDDYENNEDMIKTISGSGITFDKAISRSYLIKNNIIKSVP